MTPAAALLKGPAMLLLLGISVFVALVLQTALPSLSAFVTTELHASCLRVCPVSRHAELYEALVCGESISASPLRLDFMQTGLIHLLVVSGSHLVFLETMLNVAARAVPQLIRSSVVGLALLVFTLATGASPPVTRALLAWVFNRVSKRWRLNWTRPQVIALSLATTVPLCRDSWAILSLALSTIAATAFALTRAPARRTQGLRVRMVGALLTSLKTQVLVYVAIAPALLSIAVPHPLSIGWNLLIGPLLGHVLFPLTALAFTCPLVLPLIDRLWDFSLTLIQLASRLTPDGLSMRDVSPDAVFLYCLTLVAAVAIRDTLRKRRAIRAMTFVFFLLSFPSASRGDEAVVWNVGQGSWATVIADEKCLHFDSGGERAPWKLVTAVCREKKNEMRFSHWDWDHVGFARPLKRSLPNLCLRARPGGEAPRSRATLLSDFVPCAHDDSGTVELHGPASISKRSANAASRSFVISGVLLPGDAPSRLERAWLERDVLRKVRILIVGHHGSKSSTSSVLLDRMPKLKMAVASARQARYGHPHRDVKERLKIRGVPLLVTEEWGTIRIGLEPEKSHRRAATARRNLGSEFDAANRLR